MPTWTTPVSSIERAPLEAPLSPTQWTVVMLLGLGYTYPRIADELGINDTTVRFHAVQAGRKIPGDLPVQTRCALWARGATLEVLTGSALMAEVTTQAVRFARETRRNRPPHLARVRSTSAAGKFAGPPGHRPDM